MIDIVLFIFFVVAAVRIFTLVRRESATFREFKQPQTLALVALLLPLGSVAMVLFRATPLLAVTAALACYLPTFLASRRLNLAFERAGTDRVKKAHGAASQAFGAALVGLIYVASVFLYVLVISIVSGRGHR